MRYLRDSNAVGLSVRGNIRNWITVFHVFCSKPLSKVTGVTKNPVKIIINFYSLRCPSMAAWRNDSARVLCFACGLRFEPGKCVKVHVHREKRQEQMCNALFMGYKRVVCPVEIEKKRTSPVVRFVKQTQPTAKFKLKTTHYQHKTQIYRFSVVKI